MRPREVVELRLEGRVIAAPARDEEQFRLTASGTLVVEPQAVEVSVRHAAAIVSRRPQKIQRTG
jgi:hypothetical protein